MAPGLICWVLAPSGGPRSSCTPCWVPSLDVHPFICWGGGPTLRLVLFLVLRTLLLTKQRKAYPVKPIAWWGGADNAQTWKCSPSEQTGALEKNKLGVSGWGTLARGPAMVDEGQGRPHHSRTFQQRPIMQHPEECFRQSEPSVQRR